MLPVSAHQRFTDRTRRRHRMRGSPLRYRECPPWPGRNPRRDEEQHHTVLHPVLDRSPVGEAEPDEMGLLRAVTDHLAACGEQAVIPLRREVDPRPAPARTAAGAAADENYRPRAIRLPPGPEERARRAPRLGAERNRMQLAGRKRTALAELDRGGVGASAARGRETSPASRTEWTGLPRRARLSSKIINDCLLCF